MNMSRRRSNPEMKRAGFTIVEMIIALFLLGAVITASLSFLTTQNEAFLRGADRMSALQNIRYAFQVIEVDVKTLGTSLTDGQPAFVYLDDDVFAFSADYASNVADDVSAVYIDRSAPTGQVTAPRSGISIPNSTFTWPDTVYENSAGENSPAELIVYFIKADTATTRTDDFAMYRQVNATAPELVARHLIRDGSEPFFSYFRERNPASGVAQIQEVPASSLPMSHSVRFHLSAADTGAVAQIDSVKALRVRLGATNDEPGDYERQAFLSRIIGMPNAGQQKLRTCGDDPFAVAALVAGVQANAETGDPEVLLQWAPSVDETSGETDVIRYIIWKRLVGGTEWGDPYLSIPAGLGAYSYVDASVVSGQNWEYAIASQDCTPTTSTLVASPTVLIP